MKMVAITALVALLVSIPFIVSRRKHVPVRIDESASGNGNRYDNEDLMM